MNKIKNIVAAALCGFVLSFLISVISTRKMGTSFLRALVFGLVFAVLCFAIGFLNDKFLVVEPSVSDSYDDYSKRTTPRTGSVVNITIDDENLTEEDHAPSFDVSTTGSSFSYKPSKNEPAPGVRTDAVGSVSSAGTQIPVSGKNIGDDNSNVDKAENGSPAFKPMDWSKAATVQKDSGDSAQVPAADSSSGAAKNVSESGKKSASVKEIDALPDIGDFAGNEIGDDSDGSGSVSVIEDSEFAQSGGGSSVSSSVAESSDLGKQNSKLIASAIRTLLKKEEM